MDFCYTACGHACLCIVTMPLVFLRYPAHLNFLQANVVIVSFIGKFLDGDFIESLKQIVHSARKMAYASVNYVQVASNHRHFALFDKYICLKVNFRTEVDKLVS